MRLLFLIAASLSYFATSLDATPFSNTISANSLLHYAQQVHSQYGEEGVIDAVMQRIGVTNGFLVEFGGYDGIGMSNTRVLAERGWRGAFIEPDETLYKKMVQNFQHLPNILCIQEFITPFEEDKHAKTIDAIADSYFPDQEIDVMCIDIDGLDHLILKNLKRKPKLIIIEGGMYWHPMMQLEVPDEVAARNVQQPITVMAAIAKAKGYELICTTFNAFFIREDLYHHFADINNEPSVLWWEALLHIKKIHPNFYFEIFQIRQTSWIQEWENRDPAITFPVLPRDTNPYAIDFPEKQHLTFKDYLKVQSLMRTIDVPQFVRPLYQTVVHRSGFTSYDDFLGRCSKGTHQLLIDPDRHLYPAKELVKIGSGGDNCIVCCGPLSGKYPGYIKSFIEGLKEIGFNGHFFYMIGGWPNPTGEEIKYAGVPYCFKIFTMLEAYKLGFSRVLWVDAACYPLREIDSLFNKIEHEGAVLNCHPTPCDAYGYIFPETREMLQRFTGVDVLCAWYINTIVFGLKMNAPEAHSIVRSYYDCVRMGTPFLSCFPEEWVLTAIMNQRKYSHWIKPTSQLILGSLTNREDSPEEFEQVRRRGIYFYHRKGR